MPKISVIDTEKTVSQTLADLRKLFGKWEIEDWEPVPGKDGRSYSVRYLRGGQWVEINSQLQPTKAMNLRVCYQVITYMQLWENRGVTGIAKGVTFVGALVPTGNADRDSFSESCAILGVDPEASWEEIERVYNVKVQFAHPDKFPNASSEERKAAEDRFKRLTKAYEYLKKVTGGGK
jgi:DnaJ-domain-containing protein 1